MALGIMYLVCIVMGTQEATVAVWQGWCEEGSERLEYGGAEGRGKIGRIVRLAMGLRESMCALGGI